jgi:hypothetical protein
MFTEMSFSQQPYRSLKECGNDTVKYLKYNFMERGDIYLYQGKTFAQLLYDLEIKPIGLLPIYSTTLGYNSNGEGNKDGNVAIELYFKCSNHLGLKYHPLKDEYITISWEKTILFRNSSIPSNSQISPPVKGQMKYESVSDLFKAYPEYDWVPQYYDFFKDQKIKVIRYCQQRY